jgi:cell division protein ZapA
MNYSEKLSIQLNIGSKTYPLEIDRQNEQVYRDAAKLINDKIHRYISNFPDQDKEDYMAMALIDIAVKLVSESNVDKKLQDMITLIDKTLKLNP